MKPALLRIALILSPLAAIAANPLLPGTSDPGFRPEFEPAPWHFFSGLARDRAGDLLVAESRFVYRLRADGSVAARYPTNGITGTIEALALGANDHLLVGGTFVNWGGVPAAGILRLQANGEPDPTFAPAAGGGLRDIVAIGVQSDGGIIVGGNFTNWAGRSVPNLVRLRPDGSLDAAFLDAVLPAFAGVGGTINRIEVRPDDRIRIGGALFAELHPDGRLATKYNRSLLDSGGVGWSTWTSYPDGRLLTVSSAAPTGVWESLRVARLLADGSLDPTLDIRLTSDGYVQAAAITADGRILLAGSFGRISGQWHERVVRLDANGVLDSGFVCDLGFQPRETGPSPLSYGMQTLLPLPEGTILVSGSFTNAGVAASPGLARLAGGDLPRQAPVLGLGSTTVTVTEGATARLGAQLWSLLPFRASWTLNGVPLPSATDPALDLRNVQLNQAGTYQLRVTNELGIATSEEMHLVVLPDQSQPGSVDHTFVRELPVDTSSGLAQITSVGKALSAGSQTYVAGPFTHWGTHRSPWIARLQANGSVDTNFVCLRDATETNGLSQVTPELVLRDGRLLVSTRSRASGAFPRTTSQHLLLKPDGATDPSFPAIDSTGTSVTAAVQTPDGGLLLGGYFPPVRTNGAARVIRLRSDWRPDPAFQPTVSPTLNPRAFALLPDGRWLGLHADALLSGQQLAVLQRYLGDGTPDPTFATVTNLPPSTRLMLLDAQGGILVGRGPVEDSTSPVPRLLRLLADGSPDTHFVADLPAGSGTLALAVASDGRLLVAAGRLGTGDGMPHTDVVRLHPDGTRDASFVYSSTLNAYPAISSLLITPAGQILIAGMAVDSTLERHGIVRLNGYDERRLEGTRTLAGSFEATIRTRMGRSYAIQVSDDLGARTWRDLATIRGTGFPVRFGEALAGNRFYRMRIDP